MGAAIGDILGAAVGVAISPVPIIAVILMLFTAKATANSISFLIGWGGRPVGRRPDRARTGGRGLRER